MPVLGFLKSGPTAHENVRDIKERRKILAKKPASEDILCAGRLKIIFLKGLNFT